MRRISHQRQRQSILKIPARPKTTARSNGKHPGGRPPKFGPHIVEQTRRLCSQFGATDADLAEFFGVRRTTIYRWKLEHPEFSDAQSIAKEIADARVERRFYEKAIGYSYDAEKIVVVKGEVKRIPYKEHVPPDTTAGIFWLKNRKPAEWRDRVEIRDVTPPDPHAEAARMKMIAFLGKTIEERARLGLPSIFDEPEVAPKLIDATDRTGMEHVSALAEVLPPSRQKGRTQT